MDTAQISEQEKVIYQENAIVRGVISSGPCIASKVSDDISGFSWMNIKEEDGVECEIVVSGNKLHKYLEENKENLCIGKQVQLRGSLNKGEHMDYLYLDDESSIEIIQNYKKQETIMPKDITEIIGKLANDVNIEEAGGEDYITLGVDVRYEVLVKKRDLGEILKTPTSLKKNKIIQFRSDEIKSSKHGIYYAQINARESIKSAVTIL